MSIISNITDIVLPSTSTLIGSISRLAYYVSKGPTITYAYYFFLYRIRSWLTSYSEIRLILDPLSANTNIRNSFYRAIT